MGAEGRVRYRMMALIVAYTDVEASSPEEADTLLRHVSPDAYELVEWIDTRLCVETRPGSEEFAVVADWTQPDLWRQHEGSGGDGR